MYSSPYNEAALTKIRHQGTVLRLFFTCWIIYSLHFSTNIVREIFPALSLGDHCSFDVSEYTSLHPDIFVIPGHGAFINNNPGASILGAIPYLFARPIINIVVKQVQQKRAAVSETKVRTYTADNHPNSQKFYYEAVKRGLDVKFALAAGVMQTFCMALISAISVVVMFYTLLHLSQTSKTALLLSVLYAFATPVFYRTAFLNHNLLLAHFSFFSFVLLWRPWDNTSTIHWYHYFFAGFLCGWTVLFDYSGVVAVFSISVYVLLKWLSLKKNTKSITDLVLFGSGVLLAGSILIFYQWWYFGHPIYPAQHYMPDVAHTDQGYRGFSRPKLDLLWSTAFGMRYGLFTSAPLLMLFFYFPGWYKKSNRIVQGSELQFIILFIILFFTFCSANQYGRVQFNTGVRHIVPIIPFLFILVARVFVKIPPKAAIVTAIFGLYWSWCLVMYRDTEFGYGIFESIIHISTKGPMLPWMTTLERMGYISGRLPTILLMLFTAGILWLVWGIGKPFANAQKPMENSTAK